MIRRASRAISRVSRAQIKFCLHSLAAFAYTLLFTYAMCGFPGYRQSWMTYAGVFSPEVRNFS